MLKKWPFFFFLEFGQKGKQPEWNCIAPLKGDLIFDKIAIACEAYGSDGAENNEVIRGSCFLNYSLEKWKAANDEPVNTAYYIWTFMTIFISITYALFILYIIHLLKRNADLVSEIQNLKNTQESQDLPPSYENCDFNRSDNLV